MHLQKFGDGNQELSEFPNIPPLVSPSQGIMVLLDVPHTGCFISLHTYFSILFSFWL